MRNLQHKSFQHLGVVEDVVGDVPRHVAHGQTRCHFLLHLQHAERAVDVLGALAEGLFDRKHDVGQVVVQAFGKALGRVAGGVQGAHPSGQLGARLLGRLLDGFLPVGVQGGVLLGKKKDRSSCDRQASCV